MAELSLDMQSDAWADLLPDAQGHISRALDMVFKHLQQDDARIEVSVVLTDDAGVQTLNAEYRGQDKPTNILSFPSGMALGGDMPVLLGDLVLTHDTIAREAQQQCKTFLHHTLHLVVHGVLHLLDFDHQTEDTAVAMEALEVSVLADLGIGDPYKDDNITVETMHG